MSRSMYIEKERKRWRILQCCIARGEGVDAVWAGLKVSTVPTYSIIVYAFQPNGQIHISLCGHGGGDKRNQCSVYPLP